MDRWRGKVAVVTGASAGIGLATVKALLREGLIVVGLARRKQKMLDEIKGIDGASNFTALQCDVTNEENVIEAFEYVKKNLKTVHVLVNNAGTVKSNTIEDATTRELQDIVNLNFMHILYCYKRAVKLMKENGEEGYIINMNSIGGHKFPKLPNPGAAATSYNVYAPTKFAVTALSEVLVRELLGCNIRVTNLSPGFVKTEVTSGETLAKLNLPDDMASLYPEDIADTIVYLLGTPLHVQITQMSVEPLGWDY